MVEVSFLSFMGLRQA